MLTIMLSACAKDGNEPNLLGHKPLHLFSGGKRRTISSYQTPPPKHAAPGGSINYFRERGDDGQCRSYAEAISKAALLLSFDAKAAWKYAALRCDRSLRAPDALQLAYAASAGVDLFVTNDRRLQGKHIEGIQFIVALDQVPI